MRSSRLDQEKMVLKAANLTAFQARMVRMLSSFQRQARRPILLLRLWYESRPPPVLRRVFEMPSELLAPPTYTMRRLLPDDAAGVADCVRELYGATYVHPELYQPDEIVRLNETLELV